MQPGDDVQISLPRTASAGTILALNEKLTEHVNLHPWREFAAGELLYVYAALQNDAVIVKGKIADPAAPPFPRADFAEIDRLL